MYQVLLSVVVGEGEGGVEVIPTDTTRMPVREDGASSFYVSLSWMGRADVFIAEGEVAVSKYWGYGTTTC